jgi:CxxC motif-containing protein
MRRELTCITCPIGCALLAEGGEGEELRVSGNRCPRGAAYAREELLSPHRTVTATCRALGAGPSSPARRIPCRSSAPFPKERVGELLAAIYALEVSLPVERGRVLIRDALGLGINVVATRTLD